MKKYLLIALVMLIGLVSCKKTNTSPTITQSPAPVNHTYKIEVHCDTAIMGWFEDHQFENYISKRKADTILTWEINLGTTIPKGRVFWADCYYTHPNCGNLRINGYLDGVLKRTTLAYFTDTIK